MLIAYRNLLAHPQWRARFNFWAPLFVLAVAAFARIYGLAYPGSLVFDETYYVKDAWSLITAGHELNWPTNADTLFAAGKLPNPLSTGSFVVHPPLGKWLIGLGLLAFGPTNPFGWRIVVALLGTATVWLVFLCAKLLFRSTLWALVAELFMAIDGMAIVLSRTALLDQILGFFMLLSFYALLRDRASFRSSNWRRPWILVMALSLGAGTAVKWSGLYFAAFFVIYVLVSDVGVLRKLAASTGDKVARSASTIAMVAPIYLLTYLASWSGWLATKGGYDRNWADQPGNAIKGILSFIPRSLQSLWHYHVEAYLFHVNLHTGHPYASSPLSWLFQLRPTSFFYEGNKGCGDVNGCSSAITALGNPALWWAALMAVIYLAVFYWQRRERALGLMLLGLAAGYLPWFAYLNRTVFTFYTVAFEPWLWLILVYALRMWFKNKDLAGRISAARLILAFIVLALAVAIFMWPIYSGDVVPYWYWRMHMWLPSWI